MQIPLQITFRGMSPSPAIEALIRARGARIERFYDRIIRCHVVVDMPHRHHRKGRQYAVHLDITTPESEIVVTRAADPDESHQELETAVRNAFDIATRQLEEDVRRRRSA
jgi:ribosome-associated translation inhibitor RaiA